METSMWLEGADYIYATEGSAGFDIAAVESVEIPVGGRKLMRTGLKIAGYTRTEDCVPELQIRSRSGLALKHGVIVLNAPGTVDCDYQGEICVILANFGDNPFKVEPGMRIAQGVFAEAWIDTSRCAAVSRVGGFGSTGSMIMSS